MIDFEAVIRHFGPQAVALQLMDRETDNTAHEALCFAAYPNRLMVVRSWLYTYRVFQGIDNATRTAITEAVLHWADLQAAGSRLANLDALVNSHAGLMADCAAANGQQRNFTSLASKALWLRYPHDVPMFDSFAQRALWITSKIEKDIAPPDVAESEYRKFAYWWRALFERYATTIASIDMQGYPYPVRIFDKILWIIGAPTYNY